MDSSDSTTHAPGPWGLSAGQRIGDRYVLERRLGVGGMASVWLANDERLGRQVAIKALAVERGEDEEFRRRFRREARLAARLQHPNLVSIYDYNADGHPYLVMEFVDGGTLAERLAAGDAPPVEELAAELLGALSSIHSAGVLHRDVKPQNVLVDPHGRTKLTDFGIAESRDQTSITSTGIVIGTETYLAPERRRGEPATERSDLYSLGVVLAEVAERDGASASTWDLIERLRAEEPDARPGSAAAALAELEQGARVAGEPTAPYAIEEPPTPPTGTDPIGTTSPGGSRRGLAAAGILAVLAIVGVGLALALGGGDDGGGGGGERAASESSGKEEGGGAAEESGGGGGGGEASAEAATSESAAPVAEEPATEASADGATLNDDGFALVQEGRYDEAIPVLEQAVDALRGSGDDLTYNYALFNLAHALRLAGRPDEAIPLLEERLAYPDQEETVAAELAAAKEEAGVE